MGRFDLSFAAIRNILLDSAIEIAVGLPSWSSEVGIDSSCIAPQPSHLKEEFNPSSTNQKLKAERRVSQ